MRKLEMESESFQAEKRAQATPLRVEQIARQQLNMRTASPAITQYVNAQGAAAGNASVPAAGGAK